MITFVKIFLMTFHDLNIKKPILTALDELGYTTPTTIQSAGFSVMMSGRDVIGLAQTGTGKTLAYLLPTLSLWKFSKEPHPQILIIVPTRELVVQVVREVEKLTPHMNVAVGGVYGGANINTQASMVLQGLDVLVGTPGRLFDLTANGSLQLKHIKKVVIDEVDETLNLGFRPQLMRIFELLPEKRQNLLFSATLSEEVETFLGTYFDSPVKIEAARVGTPLEKIKQEAFAVPNFTSKVNLLKHMLQENKDMTKVLVFVSSRVLADKLFEELEPIFNVELGIIHSQKAQNFRFNAVNHFQNGIYKVLIATDLIARGIDVTDITHVFNFDIPDNQENYIHRIGRTGRQDKEGHAISFLTEKDRDLFTRIEEFMNKKVTIQEFPDEVELSELVLDFEKPQVAMKNSLVKSPSKDQTGPAFHEKKDKNKKVNVRYNHKQAMQDKYGKPKKKGNKKK
ncbi:MAG: box helicase domain protein [Fluviicola sp.]|nr:box helicase domain protein [Fluviicola sp.]